MADKPPKPDVFKVAQLYIRPFVELKDAVAFAALLQQSDQGFDGAEIYEAARVRIFNKTGNPVVSEKDCYVAVVWDNAGPKDSP